MSEHGDHERALEREMLEAGQHVADVAHVEQGPLLIVLLRLNHQDRTLDAIKSDLQEICARLADHISRENVIKESIDDMVSLWKGSKIVGRIMTWVVGIVAAVGAAYAAAKRSFL